MALETIDKDIDLFVTPLVYMGQGSGEGDRGEGLRRGTGEMCTGQGRGGKGNGERGRMEGQGT